MTNDAADRAGQAPGQPTLDAWSWVARARAAARRSVEPADPAGEESPDESGKGAEAAPG